MIDKWFIHVDCGPEMGSNELVKDEMTQEQANEYAYELAKDNYQSYEGMYDIMDETECKTENLDYDDEVGNVISYYAEPYNPEKHDGLL